MPEANLPLDGVGLPGLEARLREDLNHLCWPGKAWLPAKTVGTEPVNDVVIVGGGMCGMVAWMALRTAGVERIRVLDRSPKGREGPWLTYARMETLRSPKQLTGPAFGHGALTFQAWFRAQFGTEKWEALDKIPRPQWMEYLKWYRKALDIPVENEVAVERIEPEGDLLRLHLRGAQQASILTRKLVMATGRDGTGVPNIPDFVRGLTRGTHWAHSSDDIDFDALRGRRVAVVGVGASAIDNAAEALEHGAAEVRHLIRRAKMPTINKMMGIGSPGFAHGYGSLPDAWRWRFMQYSFATQTPPPHGSTIRVSRHPNAYFHFGHAVERITADNAVTVHLSKGASLETDFVILGTGFSTDPMARAEFGTAREDIALWADVYTPPPGEADRDLSQFPYLNNDFTFREKTPGAAPWLSNVYCFNYGATASMGKVSGDIPGVSEGANVLAQRMCATLYQEDIDVHWQNLQAYDKPELNGEEWRPSPLPARKGVTA